MDVLKSLGVSAIAARLSVLAERYFEEVQTIYRAIDADFDPRNYLLFRCLSQHPYTVGALAEESNCTHARTSQKLTELEKQNLVERFEDEEDKRKSVYRLSLKGKQVVEKLKPVWAALEKTLLEDFSTSALLEAVKVNEQEMPQGALSSKVLARLAAQTKPVAYKKQDAIEVQVLCAPLPAEVCSEFVKLNLAWLKEYKFTVEKADHAIFADLNSYLIEHEGKIIIAKSNNHILGTALILKHDQDTYELSKFCVDKSARGKGLGKRVLAFCEIEAKLLGARKITLVTSSKLKEAQKLYLQSGYTCSKNPASPLVRADCSFEKVL
jgi:MarR family transcriptional repressor of mepA